MSIEDKLYNIGNFFVPYLTKENLYQILNMLKFASIIVVICIFIWIAFKIFIFLKTRDINNNTKKANTKLDSIIHLLEESKRGSNNSFYESQTDELGKNNIEEIKKYGIPIPKEENEEIKKINIEELKKLIEIPKEENEVVINIPKKVNIEGGEEEVKEEIKIPAGIPKVEKKVILEKKYCILNEDGKIINDMVIYESQKDDFKKIMMWNEMKWRLHTALILDGKSLNL